VQSVHILHDVTTECVHFADADLIRDAREGLLESTHLYEIRATLRDETSLFREMARALEFPDYFGHNWDAVVECLRDRELSKPFVVLLHGAQTFWREAPEVAGQLVEVWLGTAEEWRAEKVAAHLVFVW
jgi:RNAse (barnase) inhibitor barstar